MSNEILIVRSVTELPEIGRNVFVKTAFDWCGQPRNDYFCGYMSETGELIQITGTGEDGWPEEEDYGWMFVECVEWWTPIEPITVSTINR